jgi:GTP cyclohydrolase FolE2
MTETDKDERIKNLEAYIEYHATCPCCGETSECETGCTFNTDDYTGFCDMNLAREVLYGAKK